METFFYCFEPPSDQHNSHSNHEALLLQLIICFVHTPKTICRSHSFATASERKTAVGVGGHIVHKKKNPVTNYSWVRFRFLELIACQHVFRDLCLACYYSRISSEKKK